MNPLLPIFSFPRTQGFHPRTLDLWLLSLFPWCCASSSFSSQNRSRCVNIKKLTRLSLTSSYLLIFRPRFCPLHWVNYFCTWESERRDRLAFGCMIIGLKKPNSHFGVGLNLDRQVASSIALYVVHISLQR